MKKNILTILCAIAVFFGSCGNNDDESIISHLGDTVVLAINDSASFTTTNNDKLTVGFEKVISDTRIPRGLCELAYGVFEANIELSISYKTQKFNIPFTIYGCAINDQDIYKDTLDFRFHIYRLEPFSNIEVQDYSDYKLKLKVEKL